MNKSTGRDSNPRHRMTNASRRCPVRYPCRWTTSAIKSVRSEGLEPGTMRSMVPGGLRVRCAAASTLIPISRRGGSRTLALTLIRGLLSPLSYAPASRAGGTRTQGTARSVVRRITSPVCCRYTTTLCLVGRIRFNRVNIASLLFLELRQMVALRIALQRHVVISRVWATSPRVPRANVVVDPVGMAGLEPASPCSQSTWVRRYPTSRKGQNGRI